MNTFKDDIRVASIEGRMSMELLYARMKTHEFPRHYHDTYLVEVVLKGWDEFLCGDRVWRAGPGDIVFIHPGEVHTGRCSGDEVLVYRAFYPSAQIMRRLAGKAGMGDLPPTFGKPVVHDLELATQLAAAHRKVWDGQGDAELEQALTIAIQRHAAYCPLKKRMAAPRAVRQVLDLMAREPAKNWSLEELADACSYSPFYLVRMFKKSVGLPPHEYLHAYRAERARELLRQGRRAWEAAAMLGYADQAHFTRSFRRISGATPGAFRGKLTR